MATEYESYKRLKSGFDYTYKGIVMNRVMALFLWQLPNPKTRYPGNLKGFFKCYNFRFLEEVKKNNIIYNDVYRKDHKRTFTEIASKVNDVYEVLDVKLDEKIMLSIKNCAVAFYVAFKKNRHVGPIKTILLASELCMYLNTIDHLNSLNICKIDKFVAYSIVHRTQNLLAQFFKSKGAKVIGLTHGAQYVYKKNIPIDCVAYENLQAECLVWSQMTKEEYHNYGIDYSKLFVAGYPKKVEVKSVLPSNQMKKCLVLLCRKEFDESNSRLLKMLSECVNDYSFQVKLHPTCDYSLYNKICNEYGFTLISTGVLLTDCMDRNKFDFAIAVNTSSYYEIQTAGIPCLRYDDGESFDLQNGIVEDCVSNQEEFVKSIDYIKSKINSNEINQLISNSLKYNLGLGIDKYREMLLA